MSAPTIKRPARQGDAPVKWSGQPTPISEFCAASHDACDCNPAVEIPAAPTESWSYAGFEIEAVPEVRARAPQLCATCFLAWNAAEDRRSLSWSEIEQIRAHPEHLLSAMTGYQVNGRPLSDYGVVGLRDLIAWATSHRDPLNRLLNGSPDIREIERRAAIAAFAERLLDASAAGYLQSGGAVLPPSPEPEWLTDDT